MQLDRLTWRFFISILVFFTFILLLHDDLSGQTHCSIISHDREIYSNHQASRWYFGQYAGIDFRAENPVADLSNERVNVITSPAIISDSAGEILFFTDGNRVFNRLGDTMPNGSGLHGFPGYPMPALIVPRPGHDSIYYIFTTHRPKMNPGDTQPVYGLEYNEVNMNLDNGNGGITLKNKILLEPEVSSKLCSVRHSNGTDYWVVAHRFNSNEFCSFLVTENGVDTSNYVSSSIGTPHLAPGETNNAIGYMKISPDGTQLALAIFGSDMCEIFDFDPSTGIVSNVVSSQPVFNELYGVEFSPDSRFLYMTITSVSLPQPNYTPTSYLFQFDIEAGTSIFEPGSFDTIAVDTTGSYFGGIQLGPDGRIYVSRSPYGNAAVSVIQNPKRGGAECNFVSNVLNLQGRFSRYGFPNFVASCFDAPHFFVSSDTLSDTVYFHLQDNSNIDQVLWDFGDPASGQNSSTDFEPHHVFSSEGIYQVSVTEYFNQLAFGPYSETVIITNYVGLTDVQETLNICRVYPNPGDGNLNIVFNDFHEMIRITVVNSMGQKVVEPFIYKDVQIHEEIRLTISDLKNGIYFIEFCDDYDDVYTVKYILRH